MPMGIVKNLYLLTKTDYEILLGIFLYQYTYISSPFDGVIVEMEFPSSTGKLLSSKMFNHFFYILWDL